MLSSTTLLHHLNVIKCPDVLKESRKVLHYFETSGTAHPTTELHIPEDLAH
jgi:hypothetical protein